MHGAFLTGLVLGLILAVMTSPVFFALINITTTKGTEAGAMFVSGNFTGNLILFIFFILGFDLIYNNNSLKEIFIYSNGVLLIILCLLIILGMDKKIFNRKLIYFPATKPLTIFTKGILLNILNPVVIILWLGLISFFLHFIPEGNKNIFILFITGVLVITLIFDVLKLISTNIFTNKINPLYLLFFNKIIAVLIIASLAAYIL